MSFYVSIREILIKINQSFMLKKDEYKSMSEKFYIYISSLNFSIQIFN